MKKTLFTAGIITLLACAAQATVISVNFNHTNTPNLAPTDVAGVEAVANWNNIQSGSQSGSSTTGSLMDDAGAGTGTSITYFNRFWQDGASSATPDLSLNSGYTNTGVDANDLMSITGLGSAFTGNGYDVILYMSGTDGMGLNTAAEFGANVDGGTDQWIRAMRRNPVDGTFTSDTFATEALAQSSSTESNYIRFSGLTGANFTLNILKDPDTTANWGRAAVKGIQIVSTPIPEPSTVMLLGLSGMLLFVLRRR